MSDREELFATNLLLEKCGDIADTATQELTEYLRRKDRERCVGQDQMADMRLLQGALEHVEQIVVLTGNQGPKEEEGK